MVFQDNKFIFSLQFIKCADFLEKKEHVSKQNVYKYAPALNLIYN